MEYDYLVIGGYFALMVVVSFLFKKMATNSTSDYFRGGGKMLWWMVGSTAFMTQFSAWTFTGAAGKAFNDGFVIVGVFAGNAFAYIFAFYSLQNVFVKCESIRQLKGSADALTQLTNNFLHGQLSH